MNYIDPIIDNIHSTVVNNLSNKLRFNKNTYNKLNYKKVTISNHGDIFNIYKKQIEKYKRLLAALIIQKYYRMRLKKINKICINTVNHNHNSDT